MTFNINYDIAAFALSITVLVHFLSKKIIMNLPTRLFRVMLWLSFLTCSLDIATAILVDFDIPSWLVYLLNEAYLIMFVSIPYFYFLYVLALVKKHLKWTLKIRLLIGIPYHISALMIATTWITHWIFYDDPVTSYTHGAHYNLLYMFAFMYMLAALILTGRFRSRLTYSQLIPIIFYSVGVLASIVLQIAYPNVLLLQYVGALSILLMYLTVENPRDYEDKDLGIYNRRGFIRLVSAAIESEEHFSVVGMRFNGYQSIREKLGAENRQLFIKEVSDYISGQITPHELCVISDGTFVIFVKEQKGFKLKQKDVMTVEQIIEFVRHEFNSAVRFRGMEIVLSASMFSLSYPEEVQSIEDILDTIDYAAEHSKEQENGIVIHASEDILSELRRSNQIQLAMQRALANGTFEVFYQPIYSVAKKRFASAEALIRLKDEELGFISPDEFIPIAEKTGMIFEIGDFVFRKVCDMLARERLWERGIHYIEVNLSPVQCIEEGLHNKLFAIMEEYKIDGDYINLEITETATISSEEVLRRNIEPLLIGGVTFSLDDYGTGYSNLSNVISYPFHIIKIDKSMVWSAMEDERAMRALRHTVAMIKDLDINIVAEGVETLEQATLLGELGCGCLQGYYFSKPVPEKDFVKML